MAQIFYDFNDDTAGNVPTGWARGGAWGAGQPTNIATGVSGATGSNQNTILPDASAWSGGGTATGFLRCTHADVGDTSGQVEIVARVRNVPTGSPSDIAAGVGVRFNDTGLNGYGFWRGGDYFGLVERAGAGAYDNWKGSGLESTIGNSQAWYWHRVRAGNSVADRLEAWVAADVDGQPGTWQGVIVTNSNTVNDNTRTTGFVGIHLWQYNQLLEIDVVGIGTAGDAAPTTGTAPAPTITSVSPSSFVHGATGIVITGTGFGASQGGGLVRIGTSSTVPATGAVTQTIEASGWSDTSITITAVRDALAYDTTHYLYVTDNAAASNAAGYEVSFQPYGGIILRWTF